MKELYKHERDSEKVSLEMQVTEQKQVEYIFDGSIKPHKGHTLFEVNTKTLECKEAEYMKRERTVHLFEIPDLLEKGCNSEVFKNKDCVYISALNKSNALKRYRQLKGSAGISEGFLSLFNI